MSYLRDFYIQDGAFEARLNFRNSPTGGVANFGLSGNDVINFKIISGLITINDVFSSSLDSFSSCEFSVCGDDGKVTVWERGRPVLPLFESGFSFDTVYCNSGSGAFFGESVLGEKPAISNYFSGWNTGLKSGNMFIINSGSHPLLINSMSLEQSIVVSDFEPFEITGGSSGYVPMIYDTNSAFSGTGLFTIETNAGEYEFSYYFDIAPQNFSQGIEVYFESGIEFPSGQSRFFINNLNDSDIEVELFLDFFEEEALQIKTGYANYVNATGGINYVNYSGGGFYELIAGSGGLSAFSPSANSSFAVNYTGGFTGIGGRLSATGVQSGSGSTIINAVSGNNTYYVSRNVYVYEGDSNQFDLWSITYNDIDRGFEDFKASGRYTQSGFGVTGVKYRIPANSQTTGSVFYDSDYSNYIFQSLLLRASYQTSLESSAYISCKI